MSDQNGQDAGEAIAQSVVKGYEDAARRAYERAKGNPDTTKPPPDATPPSTGT